jgi:hypothetical protein
MRLMLTADVISMRNLVFVALELNLIAPPPS